MGLKGLHSYIRHSKGKSLDTVSPSAIAEANDKTLSEIETQYGSVDGFVMDELGYDSKDALYAALSAEQIDGVAMAIHQMKQGKAMIIGDQTGVGKGRQMAALIRWANRQGKKPVFFTKDDSLFSDLYRDMKDTGSQTLRPLIINSDGQMKDRDGNEAYSSPTKSELDIIIRQGVVPDGYDYVVLTYSQLSSGDSISRAEKKSKTEGRKRSMAR
ncbi:MAG: strawberry notch family protein, partial [Bacteroidales bacterium]|nr:strawberry notch family protein [Bacteroidales bacterium]